MQYSPIKPEPRFDDEKRLREMEYFQGFYPESMKELQIYVAAECDKMDYPNSPMYDEYPDRVMMNRVCQNICMNIPEEVSTGFWRGASASDVGYGSTDVEEVEIYEVLELEGQQLGQRGQWGPPHWGPPGGPPPWGPPPRPPQGPPQGPPPWGPPYWGSPGGPPPWGAPPRPPHNPPPRPGQPNRINDIVRILLLNEMQRRRCRNGICR